MFYVTCPCCEKQFAVTDDGKSKRLDIPKDLENDFHYVCGMHSKLVLPSNTTQAEFQDKFNKFYVYVCEIHMRIILDQF